MPREVEFTPEQEQLVEDIIGSLGKLCDGTELALALLAHATTQLILKTITAPEFVPVAVNQVIECLRMNAAIPLRRPVLNAEQLGARHNRFTRDVENAILRGRAAAGNSQPGDAKFDLATRTTAGMVRAAGASYAQWFKERGVELVFEAKGEFDGGVAGTVNGSRPR